MSLVHFDYDYETGCRQYRSCFANSFFFLCVCVCVCGPQIRGVQGETSAIFEKGGLQPEERHPLHAMFRTDGGQSEGANRVLPLVHVSASVFAEPNTFIIPSWLSFFFFFINHIFSIHRLLCRSRGLPFIPHLDSLPNLNRSSDGPVRLPIVDKYKVKVSAIKLSVIVFRWSRFDWVRLRFVSTVYLDWRQSHAVLIEEDQLKTCWCFALDAN